MIDHDVMPLIVIAGGCGAVFLLLCIALVRSRRRVARGPRKTSFHMVAIDPSVAELGRAAFEAVVPEPQPERLPTPRVMAVPVTPAYVALPAIDPPREPQRIARGSAPGIERVLPARPQGWEQHAPSVTARMRAVRRTH